MPTSQNHSNVKIPEQFHWVLDFINQWYEENKEGELRLVFKDGGICGLEKKEYIRPIKKNT